MLWRIKCQSERLFWTSISFSDKQPNTWYLFVSLCGLEVPIGSLQSSITRAPITFSSSSILRFQVKPECALILRKWSVIVWFWLRIRSYRWVIVEPPDLVIAFTGFKETASRDRRTGKLRPNRSILSFKIKIHASMQSLLIIGYCNINFLTCCCPWLTLKSAFKLHKGMIMWLAPSWRPEKFRPSLCNTSLLLPLL